MSNWLNISRSGEARRHQLQDVDGADSPGEGRTAAQDAAHLKAIDLHFHDIRRECASQWWEQMEPKDIHKALAVAGHSSWKGDAALSGADG